MSVNFTCYHIITKLLSSSLEHVRFSHIPTQKFFLFCSAVSWDIISLGMEHLHFIDIINDAQCANEKRELDVLCRAIQVSFLPSRNSSAADIVPHRNWISSIGIKIISIKSLLNKNSRKAIQIKDFFPSSQRRVAFHLGAREHFEKLISRHENKLLRLNQHFPSVSVVVSSFFSLKKK